MNSISKSICIILVCLFVGLNANAQIKETVAVLNIDTKGVIQDPSSMGYMVRLEMEKAQIYTVMDMYDITDILETLDKDLGREPTQEEIDEAVEDARSDGY